MILNGEKKTLIQTGGLSARNSVTGLYEGSEYEYSELARKFITDPPTIADGYAEIRTFWFPALQEAILETKTPKEALDEFAEKANATIEKANLQNKARWKRSSTVDGLLFSKEKSDAGVPWKVHLFLHRASLETCKCVETKMSSRIIHFTKFHELIFILHIYILILKKN